MLTRTKTDAVATQQPANQESVDAFFNQLHKGHSSAGKSERETKTARENTRKHIYIYIIYLCLDNFLSYSLPCFLALTSKVLQAS